MCSVQVWTARLCAAGWARGSGLCGARGRVWWHLGCSAVGPCHAVSCRAVPCIMPREVLEQTCSSAIPCLALIHKYVAKPRCYGQDGTFLLTGHAAATGRGTCLLQEPFQTASLCSWSDPTAEMVQGAVLPIHLAASSPVLGCVRLCWAVLALCWAVLGCGRLCQQSGWVGSCWL